MIGKNVFKYCCEDISLIENYDKAISDTTQIWQCHHRLETHYKNGKRKPCEQNLTRKELKEQNLYYDRPAKELIFLTIHEHATIHQEFRDSYLNLPENRNKQINGIRNSKDKMSKSLLGRHFYNNGVVEVNCKECPEGFVLGRLPFSETHKENMHKHVYNNGVIEVRAKECPEGFVKGGLPKSKSHREHMCGKHWFNNGKINYKGFDCPKGFIKGKLPYSEESKKRMSESRIDCKWWNNGVKETFQKECPEGYVSGRLFHARSQTN